MRTIKTYSKGRPFIMRFSGFFDSSGLLGRVILIMIRVRGINDHFGWFGYY